MEKKLDSRTSISTEEKMIIKLNKKYSYLLLQSCKRRTVIREERRPKTLNFLINKKRNVISLIRYIFYFRSIIISMTIERCISIRFSTITNMTRFDSAPLVRNASKVTSILPGYENAIKSYKWSAAGIRELSQHEIIQKTSSEDVF